MQVKSFLIRYYKWGETEIVKTKKKKKKTYQTKGKKEYTIIKVLHLEELEFIEER